MRQLTAKQKKLLTATLEKATPTGFDGLKDISSCPITSVDSLPADVWDELQEINDTEILWQEVNRFISDWRFARI